MSRVRQEVASVIFQADARKANASMEALQEKASSLNDAITGVKQQIEALGNVAPDHQGLISYQQQLRKLNSDLKDVQKTMSDYMRGVKAADQLWQSYMRGDIEGLSMKAIKAGQNGLRKRMENLSPGSPDDQKTLRAYEEVIKEADLVVNKFKTDAAETIQILRDGGTVSEQAMKKARDGVKSLMETVEEGTQEYRQFSQQYEYLAAKTIEFTEAQRRAKGEIVDANDARRAAVRLTRDGAEAAAREREAQDAVITAQQKEIEQTRALRLEKEKEIEQTNSQMATNMRLADAAMAERRQMEDDYQASLGAIATEKRQQAQQQAQAAHDEADRMRANAQLAEQTAQQKRTAYEQETQTVTRLDGEVKQLTEDLHALSAEPVKPKVDSSDVDGLNQKLEELRGSLERVQQMKSTAQEKIASAKEILGDTDKPWNNERVKKALEEDRITQEQNIEKLNAKWDEYWEKQEKNAREFAAVLNKAAIDDVDWDEFYTHVTGPNAEMAKSWYRVQQRNMRGVDYWGEDSDNYKELVSLRASKKLGSASDGMIEELKLLEALKRKWDEYQKALNKAREESPKYDAAYNELDKARTEIIQQERLLETYTEHERQLKEQIAETEKLSQAQQQSAQTADVETKALKQQEEEVARLTKAYEKAADEMGEIEEAWSNKIMDYVGEHYPTQATVSAKTKSPEGLKEREAMKKDSVLAQMQEQMKQEVGDADDRMMDVLGKLSIEEEKLRDIRERSNQTLQLSTQASKESATTSDELQRKQAELTAKTEELAQAKQRQAKAQGEMNTAEQQAAKAQDDANKKQVEAIQLGEKAAQAEREAATEQEHHNEVLQRQDEKIAKLQNDYDALDDTLRKQEGELAAYDQKVAQSEQAIAEAERKKAQARELSAKDMRDAIAALEERNRTLKDGEKEWTDNERLIAQYNKRLEEMKQRSAELRGEAMSLADAMKLANNIGTDGFVSTPDQMQQATKAIEQQREATIKLIQAKHDEGDAAEQERAYLTQLDGALAKIKTGFASADEVIQRFNQHLGEPKIETATQQTESLAQTLDEKLNAATSVFDEDIKRAAEDVDNYEQQIEEATQKLADMEKELAELEAKHKNSSWFRKQTKAYRQEAWRIDDLRDSIDGHEVKMDDGSSFRTGQKQWIEDLKGLKQNAQGWLDHFKKQKAEALGLTEAVEQLSATEEAREEKAQERRRMTREELTQGIKILEEEAMAQDRTTADGQKRWTELRNVIDQMNQELKESTGEWMSLADAEKLAEQAGENYYLDNSKKGFYASPEEIQKATAAISRQRDALIKTIQTKKANGEATAAEERKLADLTKKLRDLKFEQDNVNMSQEKMRMLMKQPAQAVSLDELKAAIKRADGELHRMEGSLGTGSKRYKEFAAEVKNAKQVLKEMEGQAKATTSQFAQAWSRLKTYVGMYMGFNAAWQKVTGTAGDLLTLSDKMGEVRKTTQMTADQVGRLSDALTKLDTRTSLTGLMEFSSLAGSIGLKTQEDVQGFTEAANMLSVSLPELGSEASRTLMKIADATGDLEKNGNNVRETLERVGSTVIALRANSAAAAGPITDFVSRVGAVGAQAGISIDQIAALGATVDALGGRVEMSATALSRMIPAIRNNTFEVAQAIGMTEKQLKSMSGIDQMVAVFKALHDSVKNFDMTTEEGMNAAADAVEGMLGRSVSMQDVMKQLNQQGVRAGIVFGLLSQNVDTLEKQLRIAGDAYKDNTALMDEYNKMNDTAAAKWERLKNQLEEAFVSDSAQRALGWLIDRLRWVVDLLVGDGGVSIALRTILLYMGALRLKLAELAVGGLQAIWSGIKNIGVALGIVKGQLTALQMSNVFTALAAAVLYAVYAFKQIRDEAALLKEELNRLADENDSAVRNVNRLVTAFNDATKKADSAAKKHEELKKQTETLRKEVDELKKSTDQSAEATDVLKKKEDELKTAEEKLKVAADESNKANDKRSSLISEINSKYSTYLGYMLSEKTAAEQVASAHQLIIAALKEELIQKSLNRREDAINNQYDKKIQDYSTESENELRGIPREAQQRIMDNFRRVLTSISYNAETGTYSRYAVEGLSGELHGSTEEQIRQDVRSLLTKIVQQEVADTNGKITNRNLWGRGFQKVDKYIENIWGGALDDGFGDWVDSYISRERDVAKVYHDVGVETQTAHKHHIEEATKEIDSNFHAISKITSDNQQLTDDNIRMLAQHVNAITTNLEKFQGEIANVEKYVGEGNDVSLSNAVNTLLSGISEADRKRILNVAQKAKGNKSSTSTIPTTTTNPYGDYNRVTSPYSDWNGDDLVARRKEMLVRVRALANGADVQKVLSEDAKFISEAVRKNIKTTEQAIEWYNTERLKIQDALHEKHLTNTGDWLDPKKGAKRASRMVQDEMKYYLDELDAYYTERKTRIQEAQNEGDITEAEGWRRTLQNEAEWRQRRAELQKLYAKMSAEVTEKEMAAIFDILSDRTGETTNYIKKDIANTVKFIEKVGKEKGQPAMDRIMGDLDLGIEKDYLRQQTAVGKQMDAIRDIIEKERPYNGITENLKQNLTKMGILFADWQEEYERLMAEGADMTDFNRRQAEEGVKRVMFVLEEAEHAYNTNIDEVMARMADRGMTAWVEALRANPKMQEGLMAQLRTTFDKTQEAVKKEASLWKKEAENMWNNILMPDGQTTLKQVADKAMAQLSLDQGRVSRANSLIGAGQASERVANKLAIQQMKVQLAMQQHYYNLMRQRGQAQVDLLNAEAKAAKERGDTEEATRKTLDAQHAQMALNLATTKEETELAKQREEIIARTEESQNRLYTELREWADLLTSSLQSVFEASAAGNEEYYNELAKLNLTGKGGPGAGTYIVIDNAGTSDATAHYEYLDERQALERQHEIEQQNAQAEAWKKVMDDINMKLSETITDQLNAMLQNQSIDANTQATIKNTEALANATNAFNSQAGTDLGSLIANGIGQGLNGTTNTDGQSTGAQPGLTTEQVEEWKEALGDNPMLFWQEQSDLATERMLANMDALKRGQQNAGKSMQQSAQTTFAKMTMAANMYGIAYQAMSNENLSTTQKFEMMALQAVGNYAISALTTEMAAASAKAATDSPGVLGTLWKQLGWAAAPVFAVFTGLLGGLMGLASSKISSAKSQIAQATGASVGAGRLATGMLTYAEGNVNEFTDPASLTPGRQYNVDGADGKTYRARYMGKDAKTHITNGPEFHLVGEKGREAIIDAHTTRLMQTDDTGIWQAIQTLYNGGRVSGFSTRRGRGVRAFAEGNINDFEEMGGGYDIATDSGGGMSMEMMTSMQETNSRLADLLEQALTNGIKAVNQWHGPDGIPNMYNKYQKEAKRHGEKYL